MKQMFRFLLMSVLMAATLVFAGGGISLAGCCEQFCFCSQQGQLPRVLHSCCGDEDAASHPVGDKSCGHRAVQVLSISQAQLPAVPADVLPVGLEAVAMQPVVVGAMAAVHSVSGGNMLQASPPPRCYLLTLSRLII